MSKTALANNFFPVTTGGSSGTSNLGGRQSSSGQQGSGHRKNFGQCSFRHNTAYRLSTKFSSQMSTNPCNYGSVAAWLCKRDFSSYTSRPCDTIPTTVVMQSSISWNHMLVIFTSKSSQQRLTFISIQKHTGLILCTHALFVNPTAIMYITYLTLHFNRRDLKRHIHNS